MRNMQLAEKYPNLFISEDGRAAWVCRNSRDAEAIWYGAMTDEQLEYFNEQATIAVSNAGWFVCKRCKEAHPGSDYKVFNMAAKYCKDCCSKDPDIEERANSMSYE